jgi:DNA-binding LacI/PurR family transcriptional regulator
MPNATPNTGEPRVTLKTLAKHLNLTAGTISAALNDSAAARAIPEHTKRRILAAARELNYQPNYLARSLRLQRTCTIGVIAEQIGDPYGSAIISGIEEYLRDTEYFFLTVIHRHDQRILQTYSQMLLARGVEGFITVDTSINERPALPTVAIAGHRAVPGVTNITLDQRLASRLALRHLLENGHREIAFLKGQKSSSDSQTRWEAICEVAQELSVRIRPELTIQIESDLATPELGYPATKQLLARGVPFTALFAYNDLSAIGAIWALQDAGMRVPEDVSVVGFDDVPMATMFKPELTTVCQPLRRMGNLAAKTIVERIEKTAEHPPGIVVEPDLVVRASSGRAKAKGTRSRSKRPRAQMA